MSKQKIDIFNIGFLDIAYDNVCFFESITQQVSWFNNHETKRTLYINMIQDPMQTNIIIPFSWGDNTQYDYLRFLWGNKWYYYFITNIEQVTENTAMLHLQFDVFMTHQLDVNFFDTFVDRCHVDRWDGDIPTRHTIDEGLNMGEQIMLGEPETIADFSDSVIIASSVPMGKLPSSGSSGDSSGGGSSGGDSDSGGDTSGGNTSSGNWEQGKLSGPGFRFIKGFEGFAPRKYQDSAGYWTIAYGVTLHGESDIYNDLVSKQPVSEEEGAMISYDLKNKRYGSKILNAVKELGCNKQYQFDALCSLAYNCGTGVVTGNNSLTRAIKADPTNESVVRAAWEKFYITAGGVQLAGLVARRKEECNMFLNKKYQVRPIGLINTNGVVSGTMTENNGDGWLP